MRTKAIADQLNLKSNTISTVIKNLKLKTGAKNLVDLLHLGQKYGYAVPTEKVTSYKIKLIEITRGKRMQLIRFEYWTKSDISYLVELVNGQCTSFFAEQTSVW